jgi:hypothetical protein
MHSFVTRKGNKQYFGIATKIKHSRKSINDSSNNNNGQDDDNY